jgi:transposase-like protein
MGRRKTLGRPKAERVAKPNMVAAAVDLAGGVTAVAKLCGITRQTVYSWIHDWRVERLIDALKLSRVSGIPIEKLAGAAFDDWEGNLEPTSPGRSHTKPDSE